MPVPRLPVPTGAYTSPAHTLREEALRQVIQTPGHTHCWAGGARGDRLGHFPYSVPIWGTTTALSIWSILGNKDTWAVLLKPESLNLFIHIQENIFILPFGIKLWKILKAMGIPDLSPEKPVCRSRSNS